MLFSADQTVKCSHWFRCWASFSPARGGQGQGCPQESRESPGRTIPGSRVSWLKTTAGKPWQGNWQVNYRLSDKYKWLWRWQWQKRLFYSTLLYTKCITCTQSPKSPTMELRSMVTRDANNTPHYALSIFEIFFSHLSCTVRPGKCCKENIRWFSSFRLYMNACFMWQPQYQHHINVIICVFGNIEG